MYNYFREKISLKNLRWLLRARAILSGVVYIQPGHDYVVRTLDVPLSAVSADGDKSLAIKNEIIKVAEDYSQGRPDKTQLT